MRDLGREARHPARQSASPAVVAQLDRDLDDAPARRCAGARRGARCAWRRPTSRSSSAPARSWSRQAIEERGFDDDIQAAADLATLVPIALAAAVIVNTGGLGADIAAVGGGALGTFLFEKYAHVLGSGIMADARRRWIEVRGRQLAQVLTDAALPGTAPHLRAAAAARHRAGARAAGAANDLASET